MLNNIACFNSGKRICIDKPAHHVRVFFVNIAAPMRIVSRISAVTSFDIVALMVEADDIFLEQAAYIADLYDTGRGPYADGKLIHAVLRELRYKADKSPQNIKTPYRLTVSGVGDCKSFSVFAGAILRTLGYEVDYIFTNETGEDSPTHVYVRYGAPGRETYYLDGTLKQFNREPLYARKWILPL